MKSISSAIDLLECVECVECVQEEVVEWWELCVGRRFLSRLDRDFEEVCDEELVTRFLSQTKDIAMIVWWLIS